LRRLTISVNGFTLIEVMISIALLGLITTLVISSFQNVENQQVLSADYNQATQVATSQVELIQELANTNRYTQIINRDFNEAGFRINWTVNDYIVDANGNIQATTPANSQLKQVVITVTSAVYGRVSVTRVVRISSRN
jgi:prepilin-type N-terminal cleavage/methylation domain-containing protein